MKCSSLLSFIKRPSKLTESEWNAWFHSKLSSFSFYFVAGNFGSDDILRAAAVENCRISLVSGSTHYRAKSQLSPLPVLCAAKGQDTRPGGPLAFISHPHPSPSALLTAESRLSSLLMNVGRYGFTVRQEPLNCCMMKQSGNIQTIPGFTSFPHWQIGLLA